MIQIYSKGNTSFDMNGDMVLFPKSCSVTAELNGTWKLDMVHPRDYEGRWRYIEEECILSVPTFMGDRQLFRIRELEKNDDEVTVAALPVFLDCADDCYLMDVRPTDKNGQEALNIMTAGSKYSGQSNITSVSTAYFEGRSLSDAINGSGDPTFIGRWGGEILYDNYKIIINERVGGDYGVEARYGKNMEGIEYCLDMTGVVTRIVPMAYNGYKMSGDAPWVDSPNINKYEKKYIRKIKFDDVKMREDAQEDDEENGIIICDTQAELDQALTARCQQQYKNGLDIPVISISINMVELSWMEEYKEYEILEKVSLGDDVVCRHKELGITTKERVIEITWDCIRNRVEKLTLGEESYDYFSSTNSSIGSIDSILNVIGGTIGGDGSVAAEKVRGFLDATKTQLHMQNSVAKRQIVRAILFEDLDPESELFGAMAMGTQGLQIAKQRTADNRDWDWTTAMTANGMLANIIVTGILSDKKGLNSWNLDTGEMNVNVMSIVAKQFSLTSGETIDSIAEKKAGEAQKKAQEQAAKELKEFVDAVYDPKIVSLQAQIDGQIETWYFDYQPTLSNLPASDWKTEAERARHEGDLFYWKTKGYSYRFLKEGSTWKWQIITDSDITKALADASKAQDTADSKRRIFITTPAPPYDKGDLWTRGKSGCILRCITSRNTGNYVASDWEDASDAINENKAKQIASNAIAEQTQTDILNKLSNNGADDGIYLLNGKLYVSLTALRGDELTIGGRNNTEGYISVLDVDGEEVARIDNEGISGTGKFEIERVMNRLGTSKAPWGIKAYIDLIEYHINGKDYQSYGFRIFSGSFLADYNTSAVSGFGEICLIPDNVFKGGTDSGYETPNRDNILYSRSGICIIAQKYPGQNTSTAHGAWYRYSKVYMDDKSGLFGVYDDSGHMLVGINMDTGIYGTGSDIKFTGTLYLEDNTKYSTKGNTTSGLDLAIYDRNLYTRSSSSRRYKDIIRDMDEEDISGLYGIQPVIAKYKKGYLAENDAREGKEYPMFIAEDVYRYFPDAVDFNEEGKIENWNDRIMIPAMFQMIKSQKETIDAMAGRIERLESLIRTEEGYE